MSISADESEDVQTSLELLSGLSFCVMDLETTGGNHQYDKIIEIGLVKIEHLKVVDELSYLINPQIPIPEFIQKLTSIHPEQLTNGALIENVVDEILEFMGDSILVAHNSSFDIPFFNSVLVRLKRYKLTNRTLCTNLMTKNLIPDIVNSNLSYITKIFGIQHTRAHRALEDAKATAHLLIQYMQFFLDKRIRKVNQIYYPRKKFELDSVHFGHAGDTREDRSKIMEKILSAKTPLYITFKGEKGLILDVLPIKDSRLEEVFIRKKINDPIWKTVTIKMVGSLIQGLFYLNHHFPKLPKANQTEIMDYLWALHLKDENRNEAPAMTNGEPFILICKHIIPEQFILFFIPPHFPKKDLIFRYPGHFQKLRQHIERFIKRLDTAAPPKDHLHDLMRPFVASYFNNLRKGADPDYFTYTVQDFKARPEDFKRDFEVFFERNKKAFNYPKEHI